MMTTLTIAFTRRLILLVTAVVAISGGGVCAYLLPRDTRDAVPSPFHVTKEGGQRWASRNDSLDPKNLTEAHQDMIHQLEALGYMTAVQKADRVGGASVRDVEKIYSGYGIYLSGHGLEATLIDLKGHALHSWRLPSRGVWKRTENLPLYFRRAYVWPNGDLAVIVEGVGIVKMDRRSRILWKVENGAHHDFQVMANGDIYTLAHEPHLVPRLNASRPVFEDFVVGLHADGSEFARVSILGILLDSEKRDLVRRGDPRLPPSMSRRLSKGDLLHLNTLEMVLSDHDDIPWMKKGTVITSSPHLCALMAFDLTKQKLTWYFKKDFTAQHEPRLLDGEHILLFDNHNDTKQSRVVEFNARTGETVWQYDGEHGGRFFSQCCGTVRRLPNGNTQIVITDMGKVIEVTSKKTIVWEFYNPHRSGEDGGLVASIFDMVRLPSDFPLDWADVATVTSE